jgi:transposase
MEYSDSVKARMLRRLTGPDGVSANALSVETGIPQSTLSRWLRAAGSIKEMSGTKPTPPAAGTMPPRRPQDWSPLERAQAVVEASRLSDDELGEFLRSRGLHQEHLDEWRQALEEALSRGRTTKSEAKRIRELEREVARKDKALAEATALLVLKKKLAVLWGDEDDDTPGKNGK